MDNITILAFSRSSSYPNIKSIPSSFVSTDDAANHDPCYGCGLDSNPYLVFDPSPTRHPGSALETIRNISSILTTFESPNAILNKIKQLAPLSRRSGVVNRLLTEVIGNCQFTAKARVLKAQISQSKIKRSKQGASQQWDDQNSTRHCIIDEKWVIPFHNLLGIERPCTLYRVRIVNKYRRQCAHKFRDRRLNAGVGAEVFASRRRHLGGAPGIPLNEPVGPLAN
ncbi:hypothetical protein EVAR_75605_1 [Eumeta japonica]|uniref:Uncharacterized protein n=1 Tax=Eumeta variegata TaxID=151549 RepID=A0A4C1TZW8_EUMVA|nr:hypothetical protein EVAR_75605_1 [Eumeta japonica]